MCIRDSPTRKLTCRILALGLPSLLTQMLSALVQITLNNLMRAYGSATVYGLSLIHISADKSAWDMSRHTAGYRSAEAVLRTNQDHFSAFAIIQMCIRDRDTPKRPQQSTYTCCMRQGLLPLHLASCAAWPICTIAVQLLSLIHI